MLCELFGYIIRAKLSLAKSADSKAIVIPTLRQAMGWALRLNSIDSANSFGTARFNVVYWHTLLHGLAPLRVSDRLQERSYAR